MDNNPINLNDPMGDRAQGDDKGDPVTTTGDTSFDDTGIEEIRIFKDGTAEVDIEVQDGRDEKDYTYAVKKEVVETYVNAYLSGETDEKFNSWIGDNYKWGEDYTVSDRNYMFRSDAWEGKDAPMEKTALYTSGSFKAGVMGNFTVKVETGVESEYEDDATGYVKVSANVTLADLKIDDINKVMQDPRLLKEFFKNNLKGQSFLQAPTKKAALEAGLKLDLNGGDRVDVVSTVVDGVTIKLYFMEKSDIVLGSFKTSFDYSTNSWKLAYTSSPGFSFSTSGSYVVEVVMKTEQVWLGN